MKISITGSQGTGKSHLIRALKERGYVAYDIDHTEGAAQLEKDGRPTEWPEGVIDWNVYHWNMQRPVINELLASAETVFIAGLPGNWREFLNDFDKIVVLTVTPETQLHRLQTRNVHKHGQSDEELHRRVASHDKNVRRFLQAGAVAINSEQSVEKIIEEILLTSNQRSRYHAET